MSCQNQTEENFIYCDKLQSWQMMQNEHEKQKQKI